jgi:hypothetical protein
MPCELSIVIYGPFDMCEEIGDFFQKVNMYLQDPKTCDFNVRYCNPHCLSSLDLESCPMMSEMTTIGTKFNVLFEDVTRNTEFLDMLDTCQDLPEAPQPDSLLSSMKR